MKNIAGLGILCFFLLCGCSFTKKIFPPSPEKTLQNDHFIWQKDSTEHFYCFYEVNSTASGEIEKIKSYLEANYYPLLKLLGIQVYPPRIKFFMLESREKMALLFGYQTNGKSIPKDNATWSVIGPEVNALAMHEICHVISNNVFGNCKENWINEGLAVYSDNEWYGYDLHQLSNYFLEKDKIIPLKELFGKMKAYNSMISYPEAGSIVKFIYEKYGLDAIKVLWTEGSGAMQKATGQNMQEIGTAWKKEIKRFNTRNVRYNIH